MAAEQITLNLNQNVQKAMDYAFSEAEERLTSGYGSFSPFTVIAVDDGFEVDDHPAQTEEEVRDSVKILLAQDMPEGYALCYDGFVETDDGDMDAVVVEVADRGAAEAYVLALPYTCADGDYTFDADYGFVGTAKQLYPAGTKPIVSGLATLKLGQVDDIDDSDIDDEEDPAGE